MPLYSPSHRSSAKGQSPVYRETRRSVTSGASERSRHPRQTPKSGRTDQKKYQGQKCKIRQGRQKKTIPSLSIIAQQSGPEVNQTETSLASQEGDTDHDWIYDKTCKQLRDTLGVAIWDKFSKSQVHVQFGNEKGTYQGSWQQSEKKKKTHEIGNSLNFQVGLQRSKAEVPQASSRTQHYPQDKKASRWPVISRWLQAIDTSHKKYINNRLLSDYIKFENKQMQMRNYKSYFWRISNATNSSELLVLLKNWRETL